MLKYKSGTVITSLNMRKPVFEQRSSKVRVNNNKSSIFLTGLRVEIFFVRMAQNLSLHVNFRMLIFLVLLR